MSLLDPRGQWSGCHPSCWWRRSMSHCPSSAAHYSPLVLQKKLQCQEGSRELQIIDMRQSLCSSPGSPVVISWKEASHPLVDASVSIVRSHYVMHKDLFYQRIDFNFSVGREIIIHWESITNLRNSSDCVGSITLFLVLVSIVSAESPPLQSFWLNRLRFGRFGRITSASEVSLWATIADAAHRPCCRIKRHGWSNYWP